MNDDALLLRAIELAMKGRGHVEPNPMVGCVLARDGQVIGEGWHQTFGGDHAEPAALHACQNLGRSLRGATAYVTLEPCCHTTKKTPPCAPRLIAAGITRVIVGCLDPNPDVNGKGIQMLRAAGVEVVPAKPPLADLCRQLIAPFTARTVHRRPYVTMKWAETADGFVAGPRGQRLRITCPESDLVVHALRGRCDAIAVGTNTVLADDPMLTARGVGPPRVPIRVVFSNSLKLPLTSRLAETALDIPVILYCSHAARDHAREQALALETVGVQIVALPDREADRFSLGDALRDLADRGVTHLLIEPGPTLSRFLLERAQADRVWVFRSPVTLGQQPELPIARAPRVEYPAVGTTRIGNDTLTEYLNPASDVFFAPTPSVDFLLASGQLPTGRSALALSADIPLAQG